MNPIEKTEEVFMDALIYHIGHLNKLSNMDGEQCVQLLVKAQESSGIPASALASWLCSKENMPIKLKDFLLKESNILNKKSQLRTTCVSLASKGFLFMRENRPIILKSIPICWNSDMELHELVYKLRIEEMEEKE